VGGGLFCNYRLPRPDPDPAKGELRIELVQERYTCWDGRPQGNERADMTDRALRNRKSRVQRVSTQIKEKS